MRQLFESLDTDHSWYHQLRQAAQGTRRKVPRALLLLLPCACRLQHKSHGGLYMAINGPQSPAIVACVLAVFCRRVVCPERCAFLA